MFRQLFIRDCNGQNYAEFIPNPDPAHPDRIVGWPTVSAVVALHLAGDEQPPWVMPGRRFLLDEFLKYLTGITARDVPDPFTVHSGTKDLQLTRSMSAAELGQLLDVNPAVVRAALRDHLTFPAA